MCCYTNQELDLCTSASPRLAHLLPLAHLRRLSHNNLACWADWVETLHGLEVTYGLLYGPAYQAMFHRLHQLVLQAQIGAFLDVRYLEAWLLSLLAFLRRASRDPFLPAQASDTTRYPAGWIPGNLAPEGWCDLFASEFHFKLRLLEPALSEGYRLSMLLPLPTVLPDPGGVFTEKPPNNNKRNNNAAGAPTTGAAATATASTDSAPTLPAQTSNGSRRGGGNPARTPGADSTKPPRPPASDRICAFALCQHYNIPVLENPKFAGGVPAKCPATCEYLHVGKLPAGMTRTKVVKLLEKTMPRLLSPANIPVFNAKVLADERISA